MAGTGSIYVSAVRAVGDIQATHQYDVDVRFDIAFDWGGYNDYGAPYSITCDGSTQSGTSTFNVGSGGGSWVWTNIGGTKTFRITMPTSGAAKNIGLSATINAGVNPSTISASGSHVLSAVTWQWTVSYNANGGSGAPGAQVKTYGATLTLSSTTPTRPGYTFKGWATSSSGGVSYAAGGNYTANASVTLYAVWQINTYTVSYNANGGSGAPSAQTKTYGKDLTLSGTKPTRTNYDFLGWATSESASSAQYSPGGTYTANASVTLYAVWKLAYWKPRISSLKVDRCDSDGTLNAYGTCSNVTFKWECCQTAGANNVKTITIQHAVSGSTSYTSTAVSASGTSGNVDQVIGSSGLSAENAYAVRVTVTDNKSGSTTASVTLNGAEFTIDFKAGGKGVAIGKPAEINNAFDVNYSTLLHKDLLVDNSVSIHLRNNAGITRNVLHMNNDNVTVFGWEAYNNQEGALSICGAAIYFNSHNPIHFQNGTYGIRVGDNVALWTDSEGGHIRIVTPKGIPWEIDAYNEHLRIYHHNPVVEALTCTTDGSVHVGNNLYKNGKIVYSATLLYSSSSTGTTGTVTLSETAANFHTLEIFYIDGAGANSRHSVKVYVPNNKIVACSAVVYVSSASTTQIGTTHKLIIGTTITNVTARYVNVDNASVVSTGDTNVFIYCVIGYR